MKNGNNRNFLLLISQFRNNDPWNSSNSLVVIISFIVFYICSLNLTSTSLTILPIYIYIQSFLKYDSSLYIVNLEIWFCGKYHIIYFHPYFISWKSYIHLISPCFESCSKHHIQLVDQTKTSDYNSDYFRIICVIFCIFLGSLLSGECVQPFILGNFFGW